MKQTLVYTLSILFIMLIFVGCTEQNIYFHKGTPCEGKIFSPEKETILLQKQKHSADGKKFAFSIYDLELYDKYIKEKNITYERLVNNDITAYRKEIKLYPQGSSFKILGFYTITSKSFEATHKLSYYLVRSIDDNKTIWLYAADFNSENCNIELRSKRSAYSYNLDKTKTFQENYKSVPIDNGYFMPDSYSYYDDMLSISRKRLKN